MQIYGPFRISTTQAAGANRVQPQSTPEASTAKRSSGPVDQLDLSSGVSSASRLENTSPVAGGGEIRIDRVAEIRRQIASGSYDTPEKMDAALDRFLDQWG